MTSHQTRGTAPVFSNRPGQVSATPSPPIPTPVSVKTGHEGRGPPPGFSPQAGFMSIARKRADGSTHSSTHDNTASPVQPPPLQVIVDFGHILYM